jgi:hypothetical protein
MGKDARGLTLFWSINYLVPPELGVNRRSRQRVEAVVNATNMTSPVVTPEAEFVNPWRARCRETGTAGSGRGPLEKDPPGHLASGPPVLC